ncbi:MAG TPA: hypothetical protein VIK28_03295 [Sedimentisphaerales bacterium]
MWQVLAYAGVMTATLCVGYGFWMVSSLYKDFPDVPTDQLNYAFLTKIKKYKGRIAIFFAIVAVDLVNFLAAFTLQPR